MDTARLVLDYFEVLVWPAVVAGLVATVLVLFRPQIGELIDRLRKLTVGPGSAQFGAGPQAAPGREEATDEVPEKIAEIVRREAEGLEHDYQSRLADLYDRFAATDFYWFPRGVGFLAYLPWAGIPPQKPW